jgi:hypothetical protein
MQRAEMQGAEMKGTDGGGGDPASLVRKAVESSQSVSIATR